jgi:hypothetical protein
VLVVMIGVLALRPTGGGDDTTPHTAAPVGDDTANPVAPDDGTAADQPLAVAATRAATLPEVGPGWTFIGTSPIEPDDPITRYPCMAGRSFPLATTVSNAQYAYELTPDNIERGHLVVTVRVMASASDATRRATLQGEPQYMECLPAFDDEQFEGSNAQDLQHLPIERLDGDAGVGAVRYRDPLTFTFRGEPQAGTMMRGYFAVGRYHATVNLQGGGPDAEATFDAVLRQFADRLAALPQADPDPNSA